MKVEIVTFFRYNNCRTCIICGVVKFGWIFTRAHFIDLDNYQFV